MQQRATPAATPTEPAWARLPAAVDATHPVGNWLLQMGFDLWIRTCYDREVVMPENFALEPGSLIASNHQRDVDGPMLGIVLARRKGLHFQGTPPFYATREDLFRPGILARLTVHWPTPLPALLGHISLAWFFPLGRTEPMRRVREFTLGEALHALLDAGRGDADCGTLLNARGQRELDVRHATLAKCIDRANPVILEKWWGLRRLRVRALEAIAPAFRATIDAQLAHFARRLDRGCCVYFSPEGTISMDGHFSRTRGGFFRLVHLAAKPPWVQPMALGYDTLGPGRSRVVARIGERFRADTSLDRRTFDATLRDTILQLAPVTPSHLLARWLLHGPRSFTRDELAGWIVRCCTTLRAAHPSMDPLFARKGVTGIAHARLRWMERKNLVVRRSDGFETTCPLDAPPGWHTRAGIARYLDNNLADLVPGVDRVLPC
jgi:1-acyl-sn-glycerol-3-phosphate acyltransferase